MTNDNAAGRADPVRPAARLEGTHMARKPAVRDDVAEMDAPEVDRVTMPSIRADGTPDQSDGFFVIEA